MEVERLSVVELCQQDVWQTAPNHSRPATCVVKADTDAEVIRNGIRKTDSEAAIRAGDVLPGSGV